MSSARVVAGALAVAGLVAACATSGSAWMDEPLTGGDGDGDWDPDVDVAPDAGERRTPVRPEHYRVRSIGGDRGARQPGDPVDPRKLAGRVIGKFRNTYYDFPAESDFEHAETVAVKDQRCRTIKDVPRSFYETLCVQGSGLLSSGRTVSFAKRDCDCAAVCPKTSQKICFDALDPERFPWGRGALGRAITPLLTIAVDPSVVPMSSAVYIPEYDGMPLDAKGGGRHDGCFVAEDKGMKVKDKHVDIFTGHRSLTQLWNNLVPSNAGVHVVLDSPRCDRAGPVRPTPEPPGDED